MDQSTNTTTEQNITGSACIDPVKAEVTALGTVIEKEPEPREVAYVVEDHKTFGKFEVVKSANAWWMEQPKVERLIESFKAGHTIKSSCVYADISEKQWRYFNEMHPDFGRVKAMCEEVQMFRAMNTINNDLDEPKTARWFLDRRHPKFASKVRVETEEPLKPVINNNVAIGNININTGEISSALREIAREVFGADEKDSGAITDEVVASISQVEHQ